MTERMNIDKAEPAIYKAMEVAEKHTATFTLDRKLAELIKIRVSQINGCGYCVNMHSADAIQAGETHQRVFALSVWWETPYFTEKEQSALKLAEEVTLIAQKGVTDHTYENARRYFSEQEIAQLIFIVTVTNSWNRIAVSTHMIAE